jgi:hypothetical protein
MMNPWKDFQGIQKISVVFGNHSCIAVLPAGDFQRNLESLWGGVRNFQERSVWGEQFVTKRMAAGGGGLADEELSLLIPLRSLYEYFICPICFDEITDAYMTQCGHNYCEKCIKEAVDRQHRCSLCNTPIASDQNLIKNHALDQLLSAVHANKKQAADNYMKNLLSPKVGDPNGGGAGVAVQSPVESVFQKHARKSLLAYEEYYESLVASTNKKKAELKQKVSGELDKIQGALHAEFKVAEMLEDYQKHAAEDEMPVPLQPGMLSRSSSEEAAVNRAKELCKDYKDTLRRLDEDLAHCVDLLVKSYDTYMSSIAPSPFLVPIPLTLRLANKKLFFDVSLRSTTIIRDLRDLLKEKTSSVGNGIVDFGPDSWIGIRRKGAVADADKDLERVVDERVTLHELKVDPGSDIVLCGAVRLAKDAAPVCFSVTYEPGAEVDYLHCKTCKLNWICAPCADACHSGHVLLPFRKAHKPSYACCYCVKKKLCKIQNKASGN